MVPRDGHASHSPPLLLSIHRGVRQYMGRHLALELPLTVTVTVTPVMSPVMSPVVSPAGCTVDRMTVDHTHVTRIAGRTTARTVLYQRNVTSSAHPAPVDAVQTCKGRIFTTLTTLTTLPTVTTAATVTTAVTVTIVTTVAGLREDDLSIHSAQFRGRAPRLDMPAEGVRGFEGL